MNINRIEINNFRNIKNLQIKTTEGFNFILGKNAQGKSNFIEALYTLGLGRSYRANKEEEVINFNENFCRVEGEFREKDGDFILEILWEKNSDRILKKNIKYNHNPIQKLSFFIEIAPMVLMTSEDTEMVRGIPDVRRKFLDLILCRIHPVMVDNLKKYKKILDERNRWLKLMPHERDQDVGAILTEQLIKTATLITQGRRETLDFLTPQVEEIFFAIFGSSSPRIRYRSSVIITGRETQEEIKKRTETIIQNSLPQDMERGFTHYGPHRDDLEFSFEGRPVKTFSSQGEIRSFVTVLKMAELLTIREKTGKLPVLLIDDCLNEFDHHRIRRFLNFIGKEYQVFYATTEVEDKIRSIANEPGVFYINQGNIQNNPIPTLNRD